MSMTTVFKLCTIGAIAQVSGGGEGIIPNGKTSDVQRVTNPISPAPFTPWNPDRCNLEPDEEQITKLNKPTCELVKRVNEKIEKQNFSPYNGVGIDRTVKLNQDEFATLLHLPHNNFPSPLDIHLFISTIMKAYKEKALPGYLRTSEESVTFTGTKLYGEGITFFDDLIRKISTLHPHISNSVTKLSEAIACNPNKHSKMTIAITMFKTGSNNVVAPHIHAEPHNEQTPLSYCQFWYE